MPLEVRGKTFYKAKEVAQMAGVTRQTLWRWQRDSKIPAGRRYRGRERLYTLGEAETVHAYAHRMEPSDAPTEDFESQLNLFS
jgi:transcriptional regulator with XRE-family HTH domain